MVSCRMKCIFQLRHFTACNRSAEDRKAIAGRFLDLPEEEVRLIEAVNRTVGGNIRAADSGERQHVHPMHDLVARAVGGDLARPADQERHADAALKHGEVLAAPQGRPNRPKA